MPGGTIIGVPASAFVDADGKPVSGPVSIDYKEYKDAADVFISGIPMEYDSAGQQQLLQTAGMFEIYGFDSTGKQVFIHPDKKVDISMLSDKKDPDYNFYAFDSTQGTWTYNNRSVVDSSKKTETVTASTESDIPPAPLSPQKYDPDGFVFDMKIDPKGYPEFENLKGLVWQYSGEEKSTEDPRENKWVFQKKWSDVKLELLDREKSTFRLVLTSGSAKYQTTITPVLAGKSYDRAKKEYDKKFEAYTLKYKQQIDEEAARAARKNIIYRTVGISAFGIYNHDRIYSSTNPLIAASFQLENGESLTDQTVYYLYGGDASVMQLPSQKWNYFKFANGPGNCLITFLKNGKVAIFNNADFSKLDMTKIAQEKKCLFKLKEMPESEVNAEALRAMMKI